MELKTVNPKPKIMLTSDQILEKINVYQVLVKSTNYIQYIDTNKNFKEIQKDYKNNRWYEFKSIGSSINPNEIFIKYID